MRKNRCKDGFCGADDCERCRPGSGDLVECALCSVDVKRHHSVECRVCGAVVCGGCSVDGLCSACQERIYDQ